MASTCLVAGAAAAKADFPECGQIQQPKVLTGVATPEGAQFSWESKGPGVSYSTYINRYHGGKWHKDDGLGEVGGALGQFVHWVENGFLADSVSLSVIQNCYGQAWGVPFTVQRNAAPASKPPASTTSVLASPSKDWSEITVSWAPVNGATEYQLSFYAPGSTSCTATVTGTQYLWQKNSTCSLPGRYGSYSVGVVPVGPDIAGVSRFSNFLTYARPKIRCVNESTLKIKNFAGKKCPSGWVER